MPLYDCVLLLKPHVKKEAALELASRIGRHVYQRNGVLTQVTSFGEVQLGYGIKKLDGRHFKGQLMQMTMMATPNMNKELQYLNKEDRLLRWLLVRHRDINFGKDLFSSDDINREMSMFPRGGLFDDEAVSGDEDEDDNDDEEYAEDSNDTTNQA